MVSIYLFISTISIAHFLSLKLHWRYSRASGTTASALTAYETETYQFTRLWECQAPPSGISINYQVLLRLPWLVLLQLFHQLNQNISQSFQSFHKSFQQIPTNFIQNSNKLSIINYQFFIYNSIHDSDCCKSLGSITRYIIYFSYSSKSTAIGSIDYNTSIIDYDYDLVRLTTSHSWWFLLLSFLFVFVLLLF